MGVPFSRLPDGRIAQRPFGGHANPRACYAADRTGHALLHTLYGELVRYNVKVYPEWYMLGLVIEDNVCRGITRAGYPQRRDRNLQRQSDDVRYRRLWPGLQNHLQLRSPPPATASRAAYRVGIPLEDMEFVQFHPTGLYSHGILLSEGARGEGGYLLNGNDERFMAALRAGAHGACAARCCLSLDLQRDRSRPRRRAERRLCTARPAPSGQSQKLDERLPQITELARDYLGVDPVNEPVPIQPTAHYSMGGIPTDADGRVVTTVDGRDELVVGFFAAGECACASVHGANRLGTNSLLEATVYRTPYRADDRRLSTRRSPRQARHRGDAGVRAAAGRRRSATSCSAAAAARTRRISAKICRQRCSPTRACSAHPTAWRSSSASSGPARALRAYRRRRPRTPLQYRADRAA